MDRGSVVKKGDLLVELTAPEMTGADCRRRIEVPGLRGGRSGKPRRNWRRRKAPIGRMKEAAETPGAIAGNELIQAEKQVEAAQAL